MFTKNNFNYKNSFLQCYCIFFNYHYRGFVHYENFMAKALSICDETLLKAKSLTSIDDIAVMLISSVIKIFSYFFFKMIEFRRICTKSTLTKLRIELNFNQFSLEKNTMTLNLYFVCTANVLIQDYGCQSKCDYIK